MIRPPIHTLNCVAFFKLSGNPVEDVLAALNKDGIT